ncbi:MAG: serine protease [Verrucomicrobiota bacterium]|nr:serine protease [Verrucomicrobiota bacterium]
MRKYAGPIIAGVNADDRLEQLIQKLGTPSEVADFNPNDKNYQWRRKDYVINARIAMEDLVTTGLPFKRHQIERDISIEDITPYADADRDKELRREMVGKEKALIALSGATLTPKEIFQKYNGRVVEVQAINSKGAVASTGTGFILRGTEILTNYHVVAEARSIRIKRGEELQEARFLTGLSPTANLLHRFSHYSPEQDWIQLFLWGTDLELPSVTLSTGAPEVGESVTVIGNPEGLTNTLSTGIVSGIREVEGTEWIQITAPVSHGSSGSPVFDSQGRLIGLATMMLFDGQNLNFAALLPRSKPACLPKKWSLKSCR